MKGMQKIKRGTGFRGVLEYALDDGKGEIIGGNMIGFTPKDLAKEFGLSRKMREDVEKPVWHNSLRLPNGEHISNEKWVEIADDYMTKMGFTRTHQRVYALHDDEKGQHIHIIASRINLDGGKLYLGKNENLASTKIIRELEVKHNLTISIDSNTEVKHRVPPTGELGMAEREGKLPIGMRMQSIIDDAAFDKPTFEVFVARLELSGMTIVPTGATGQPQGVSFGLDGEGRKGSELHGKSYAWAGIKARIDYDPARDQRIIDRLRLDRKKSIEEEKGEISQTTSQTAIPSTPGDYWKGRRTLDVGLKKEITDDQAQAIYRWNSNGAVALIDHGDRIAITNGKNINAIKASLQLAKDKGWASVRATGSPEFQRQTWLMGNQLGIEIEGYEPTQADKEELKQILEEKKNERRKNKGNASPGQEQRAGDKNHGGAEGAGSGDGDKPIVVSQRTGRQDDGSNASEAGARQQAKGAIELQATGGTASTDTQSAADAINNSGADNRINDGGVHDATESLSDIARTIGDEKAVIGDEKADREQRRDTAGRDKARDIPQKVKQWEKQHAGLGAEKYRITLKPRAEKDIHGNLLFNQNFANVGSVGSKEKRDAAGVAEKFLSAGEVVEAIPKLKKRNLQGYDIYITPIDDRKHFILIDDLTDDNLSRLLKVGIEPAIIQKSSEGNKQAIITIDKQQDTPNEQSLANTLLVRINKKFGDPNITGVIHPFRMAGFSNKKAGKNNHLTTVELSIRRDCKILSVEMQKFRDVDIFKKQDVDRQKKDISIKKETDKEVSRRLLNIDSTRQQIDEGAVTTAYRNEFKKRLGLVKSKGWTQDNSKIDFAVAKELLKAGYIPALIEQALLEASPDVATRHRQTEQYAAKVVENAGRDASVIAYIERAERAANDDRDISWD